MPGSRPAVLALVAGTLCWGSVCAQTPGPTQASTDWLGKQFGYVADNESLRALLYEFGTTLGVPVIVSSAVNVVADGEVPVASAERFLAEIHARYGLIWVYDGTMLYLYDGTESVSETVPFPSARRSAFQNAVETTGIRGVPLNWIHLPAENALQLSGPPRFVEWAAELAKGLAGSGDMTASLGEADFAIRIFEVEHGYADGSTGGTDGVGLAGLAEMIAKLMNVGHVSGMAGAAAGSAADGVSKMRGSGLIGAAGAPDSAGIGPVVAARGAGDEAFVFGDPRLNAIVVRDLAARMPVYERLIAELDRPVDQIEIAVSVLDVDASAAEELGFEFASGPFEFDMGAADATIRYDEEVLDVEGIAVRIRALHNAGRSRVLTRPSVTTLDNHEASFRNNRTFYVRLGGNDAEAVDLAPVSYGWVVRIRPHIVYGGDHRLVQLAIHIEDGSRGGADLAVTGVPEVSQNVIRTRAVVREGGSLLIGGYTVREQTRFRQRIPVVGRIPLVGRLLSARADRDQSVARYFLITPTILHAGISYSINTGFEGDALDRADAVAPVPAAANPAPTPQAPAPVAEPVDDTGQGEPSSGVPAREPPGVRPTTSGPGREVFHGPRYIDVGAYPAGHYAVQVIALSSADRLDAFVQAHGLQHMMGVARPGAAEAGFALLEGVYPDRAAALAAAERLRDDDRFGIPFVRRVESLRTPTPILRDTGVAHRPSLRSTTNPRSFP
ncbi:MAG: hypothetical protein OXH68_12280 [Gammaproteobacteria bacterium]|nr:hypothetical protein [Gammaproteobacteria bacterium]